MKLKQFETEEGITFAGAQFLCAKNSMIMTPITETIINQFDVAGFGISIQRNWVGVKRKVDGGSDFENLLISTNNTFINQGVGQELWADGEPNNYENNENCAE